VTDKRSVKVVIFASVLWVLLAALVGVEDLPQPGVLAALPLLQDVRSPSRRTVAGEVPSLAGATGWVNSPPLTAAGLRGKVVLIDFWTYSCIYWRREFPYVRAWASKYKDQGLVAKGRVRHHHFGEGDYAESERMIQRLLSEAGATDIGPGLVSVDARGAEAPADWANLKSPETYVGYGLAERFASVGGPSVNQRHVYSAPVRLHLNQWALSGDWGSSERRGCGRARRRHGLRASDVSADSAIPAHHGAPVRD
jgi:thiol-disulfide isomerase/thioredoxin